MSRRLISWLLGCSLSALSLTAQALVVLQYHHISDDTPKITSTSPALFEAHLKYLKDNQFEVIGLDQLAKLIRGGEALPDKTVVITFDDGYSSVYDTAYPLLKKHNMPFAVFINTQPHDAANPNFMTWKQLREMSERGVVIANHTVSHPHLIRRREGESRKAWRERVWGEIATAEARIQKQLEQNHRLFAYPFGEYNAQLQEMLADGGYLAFGQQSGPLSLSSDRQALPRFPFGGAYGGVEDFATKVNTRPMPLQTVSVKSEAGERLIEPELPDGVVRPQLILTLERKDLATQVACFASGQGAIPVEVRDSGVVAQAPKALPQGRSRYNCTAPSGEKGRFYWYSEMFIRRQADGGWYQE